MIPSCSKTFIEVANDMGKFNHSTGYYEAPAVARDVTRIVRQVCDLWIGECIENSMLDEQKYGENLLHLLNLKFPVMIGKTVSESQTKIEIEKGLPKLPSTSDIHKFRDYVLNIRNDRYEKLSKHFNYQI